MSPGRAQYWWQDLRETRLATRRGSRGPLPEHPGSRASKAERSCSRHAGRPTSGTKAAANHDRRSSTLIDIGADSTPHNDRPMFSIQVSKVNAECKLPARQLRAIS